MIDKRTQNGMAANNGAGVVMQPYNDAGLVVTSTATLPDARAFSAVLNEAVWVRLILVFVKSSGSYELGLERRNHDGTITAMETIASEKTHTAGAFRAHYHYGVIGYAFRLAVKNTSNGPTTIDAHLQMFG